jgi:putative DNA primase/helicase
MQSTVGSKGDIIQQQMGLAVKRYHDVNDLEQQAFGHLQQRALMELTHEERLLNNGDWLLTLKQKDLLKKNWDIIYDGGMNRDTIAIQSNRPLTDEGNSERLVDQYVNHDITPLIQYCHHYKSWFIWHQDEGRWKKDEVAEIQRISKDVIRRILIEASKAPLDTQMRATTKWALQCECRAHIDGMIELTKKERQVIIQPELLDADINLLNCNNGTLNLITGAILPHSRNHFISRTTGLDYDPDAKCPLWLTFLNRIFRERKDKKEIIEFIKRAMGYSLTGSTREQVLFLLHGSGSNGKSVFVGILRALLGEYATVTESRTFCTGRGEQSNDIARLAGMRVVVASENSKDNFLDEALVKHLTGGDEVCARYLYQEAFTFKPQFKIWWSFNHSPNISDMTYSIWRRILRIPFKERIPPEEQNKDLEIILKSELRGILNFALEGLLEYQKIGLNPPIGIQNATKEYQEDQDVLLDWWNLCVEEITGEDAFGRPFDVMAKDALESFKQWAIWNNPDIKMSMTKFGKLIEDRGVHKKRMKDGIHYFGIKVKQK